ncbi:MAG: MgtC/SapB family protein [Myxococcota bacterium]|nr:MgtC/SapB family protein [Myxococcota bacterium]
MKNLTIAASVWFVAAVGMVIGYGGFLIAGACAVYAVVVPRIPHVETWLEDQQDE